MMYESADIIQYLREMSGDSSKTEEDNPGVCIPG